MNTRALALCPWFRRPPLAVFLAFGLLLLALPATGQSQSAPAPQLSDSTSAGLGQLRLLTDAKNYPAALTLINALAAAAPADSYDLAILLQVKTQVLLSLDRYDDAIAPLRQALDLGDRHAFFDTPNTLSQLYLLAQLYGQKAAQATDPAARKTLFAEAQSALQRRRLLSPQSDANAELLSATLFYEQAATQPDHVDLALIHQARDLATHCLLLALHPQDDVYQLLLACDQQLGEQASAADTLELLLQRHPDNVGRWRQLTATYLALASSAPTRQAARAYNLRAILTLERAQARHLLDSPAENSTLIALYLNLHQFAHAIDLLQQGLQNSHLENTPANWRLLASAYQQTHDDTHATATLTQAVALFPQNGPLEFSLAQLLYDQHQPDTAYTHLQAAVAKGGLSHPREAIRFLAYLAYEHKDYAAAIRWAREPAAQTDASRSELDRLIRAAESALKTPASRP